MLVYGSDYMIKEVKCLYCKHFLGGEIPACKAFPKPVKRKEDRFLCAIPDVIFTEQFDHTKAYPGDNGIRYEPKD